MTLEDQITIKNFRKVNDWFYRGGQPEAHEFSQLAALGISTIICLRWSSRARAIERELAEKHGMNIVFIPLNYWRLPKESEIKSFFEIVDNDAMKPVFLHCKHGADRTGMFASFYRIAKDGWTKDRAYEEMKLAGFHKFRVHHFKWAVYDFDASILS
ncbi:MAG: tyrosine-protein phosphatase [Candidatus Obscuribacterales bacterium]|nr:tyrosine-protein phosphatase [Candidatus Obscuribacterales bacterium]